VSGLRCFVGVGLDSTLRCALEGCAGAVGAVDRGWLGEKWVASENLHLTLHFIGDVPERDVEPLSARLGSVIESHQSFELPFEGVAASPNARRARMLWAEFADPDGACAKLSGDLAAVTTQLEYGTQRRAFRPHVTLCRARRPHRIDPDAVAAATEHVSARCDSMSVPSATLLASRLTPRGPVYTEVGTWRLRGD